MRRSRITPPATAVRSLRIVLFVLCAWVSVIRAALHDEGSALLPLHGEWRVAPTDATSPPPPAIPSEWTVFTTPGAYGDGSNTWFWLAREVDLGPDATSRVALLQLESACFLCQAWLNGQPCGEAIGGYAPMTMDLSAAVRPGTNRLFLRLGSWVTVATNRYPAPDSLSMSHTHHRVALWQRAELALKPRLYLGDVMAIPTVTPKRLRVEVTVVNTWPASQKGQIAIELYHTQATSTAWETGDRAFAFPPIDFEVLAHTQRLFTAEADWGDARLWWPHDPTLYALRVSLQPTSDVPELLSDHAWLRFGFREVRVQGTDLLLNGLKLVLRGGSMTRYGHLFHSKEEARQRLKENVAGTRGNAIRLHYDPMEQYVLDAADELGVLLLVQSPLLYTIYGERRRSFWDEAQDQWLRYVRHSRHHPSVVIWAVANEGTFHDYGISTPWAPSRPFLAEMARQTRAVDPTRPVTSSHDFTLGGASDFFDAVHAWGFETDPAFPKSARQWQCFHYWTFYRYDAARRYRRDRPWSNDEWAEGFNLHMGGVLFGDQAYVHVDGAHRGDVRSYWARLAQSYSTYMGMLEQRRQPYFCTLMPYGDRFSFWSLEDGTATYDPSMVELAHRAMGSIALAPLEWNSCAWAGERYERTFEVINDRFTPFAGTLRWILRGEQEQTLLEGEERLSLNATEHRLWSLALSLPESLAPASWSLELQVVDELGTEHYRDRLPLAVFPREESSAGPDFVIWPREGTFQDAIRARRFPGARVDARLPNRETPVVVPRRSRLSRFQWGALERFVEEGGRVLILEDERLPSRFGKVPLQTVRREIVLAHKKTPAHPVLQAIPSEALRYWIGAAGRFYSPPVERDIPDFVIAQSPLLRPRGGAAMPLLEAGLGGVPRLEPHPGMTLAPLLEIRHGEGRALVCTLLVAEGMAQDEPGATTLFRECLTYLADRSRHVGAKPRPAWTVGSIWSHLGVQMTPRQEEAGCWLVDARAPEGARYVAAIAHWLPAVREGAQVLLHRLSEEQIRLVAETLGLDLTPVLLGTPDGSPPYPTRLDWIADHPLRWGMGHFETDWIDTGWLSLVKARHPIAHLGVSGAEPNVQVLTRPGALAVIPVGRGRLIVDQVAWDDPISNTYIRRRAEEYIGQLLANLDVAMTPPSELEKALRNPLAYGRDRWRGLLERAHRMKR
mgnify:CR=1 FL=1